MEKRMVIDLSGYNVVQNYQNVKAAGVEGVILKVIRKDLNPDKLFETHYQGFLNVGVPIIGVYNYSYAKTEAKAITDAQKVLTVLNGRKVKVWLDVEDDCQKNLGLTLINIINQYQKVIESAGLEFGVYTGLSFYNSYLKRYASLLKCNFWIARYPSKAIVTTKMTPSASKKPAILHPLEGWQFASTGNVEGIYQIVNKKKVYTKVDMNEWYGSITNKTGSSVYIPETAGGNKLDYSPVFDAKYYVEKYPDLKAAFGTDENLLFNHFVRFGMKEARQASSGFNVLVYKDRYADLRNAFGDNLPAYYQHYVQFGKAEKRSAV